jgi:NADPH-dependent curcumin reductase CurA
MNHLRKVIVYNKHHVVSNQEPRSHIQETSYQRPRPSEHFAVEDVSFDLSTPAPKGGLVLEHRSASFDPYMRGQMRSPEIKTYFPPFELNKLMVSHGTARVLKSDAEGYHEGDIIAEPFP